MKDSLVKFDKRGKVPVRRDPDNIPAPRSHSHSPGSLAASQVMQELSTSDRRDWRKEIVESQESSFELEERQNRQVERRGFGPTSLAHAAAWARRRLALASLGIVAILAVGCGPIPLIGKGPQWSEPIHCIARYEPLLPAVDLGRDGCGNLWVRHNGTAGVPDECWFMPEPGIAVQINCPDEGDTLAVRREAR